MRGDVYELKAPRAARGQEQRGNRYGIVVQSDLLSLSTWLIAPTSTSARPTDFRPEVEVNGKTTLVLVEQTTAVEPGRLGRQVGRLSDVELSMVDEALKIVLGLPW